MQFIFPATISFTSNFAFSSATLWTQGEKKAALQNGALLLVGLASATFCMYHSLSAQLSLILHTPFYVNLTSKSDNSSTTNKIMKMAALGIAGTTAMDLMNYSYPSIINCACYAVQICCDAYQYRNLQNLLMQQNRAHLAHHQAHFVARQLNCYKARPVAEMISLNPRRFQ